MLIHWLHQFSNLSTLGMVVAVVAGLTMVAPHFGRRVLRIKENKARDDAAFDAFKAMMAMLGIVLAFSLVQANENLKEVSNTVGKEGAAIRATDRALLRIGKPELAEARPMLAAYGKSIVMDEWAGLAQGERSAKTDQAFSAISKKVRAVGPDDDRQRAQYNDLIRNLDDLADLREERLGQSSYGLSSFFWITITILLALGVVLAALTDASLSRTVGVGATSAAVAIVFSFLIIVDLPFEGETSVQPKAIEQALIANAQRT